MATKFYLHRATFTGPGTMPGGTALGGTPTVSASGASTNRWIDGTISAVAQTSAVSTTDGTSNAQTAWHTRHVSAPLAAQTISAQTITYSLAAAEANAGSNFNPTIYISLWRPGTGVEVGSILAVGTITATEPGTTQTATSGTGTSTARTAQDGDVIIIETWRKSVAPGASTARTNTTFYDGTTEASTTNVASFVNFANTLTFLPIVDLPTALSLTLTGATPTVTATDNKTSLPTALAMTLTGATPIVATTDNVLAAPTALALTLTGATPDVVTPVVSLPTALALAWIGEVPSIARPIASLPTSLALALTGSVPDVTVGSNIVAVPGALALVMNLATPSVVRTDNIVVNPSIAAFNLTLATPIVTVSDKVSVQPSALALAWTGSIPSVTVSGPISAAPAPLSLAMSFGTPGIQVSTPSVFRGGRSISLPSLPWDAARVVGPATPLVRRPSGSHASRTRQLEEELLLGLITYQEYMEAITNG